MLDDAMLAQARQLYARGVPVPDIAGQLVIATGKNAGRHPSLASVYRALAARPAAPPDAAPSDAGQPAPADETDSDALNPVRTSTGGAGSRP